LKGSREVARSIWRRLKRLRPHNPDMGDALPGDCVQVLWGGPIGFVESVSGDCATVFWHTNQGHREIIELKFLKRAAAEPAFGPDVRDDS
jgi:hypothetical protein